MPCGGLYPVADTHKQCFSCGISDHSEYSFVDEWDAFLHDRCIEEFLASPEGEIVINHGHEIIRRTK